MPKASARRWYRWTLFALSVWRIPIYRNKPGSFLPRACYPQIAHPRKARQLHQFVIIRFLPISRLSTKVRLRGSPEESHHLGSRIGPVALSFHFPSPLLFPWHYTFQGQGSAEGRGATASCKGSGQETEKSCIAMIDRMRLVDGGEAFVSRFLLYLLRMYLRNSVLFQ